MPKTTSNDLKTLGFEAEMVGKQSGDFDDYLDDLIAEQALLLSGRIGETAYAETSAPMSDYVKRAEKCLCAAEFMSRRVNKIAAKVIGIGQQVDTSHERSQLKTYTDEADIWIEKIRTATTVDRTDDFAFGVCTSDHFGGLNA